MDAGKSNLLKYLRKDVQFFIPIFQRKYSWKDKQCMKLWEDIISVGSDTSISNHFLGSIVYLRNEDMVADVEHCMIIDGQQRLTTITLLISAMIKYLDHNNDENSQINRSKLLKCIFNEDETSNDKYELVLTQEDNECLIKIIENIIHNDNEIHFDDSIVSNIKDNFYLYYNKINKDNIDILYNGLKKLIIIKIALEYKKDNPQLIFESLNSTGLDLSQADLIRNYILMNLEKKQQSYLYNTYWHEMELQFQNHSKNKLFDRFIRDYLTLKLNNIPNLSSVYEEFKVYSDMYGDTEELVKDVYKYSKYFINLVFEKEENSERNHVFKDLNELGYDVSRPFIIAVYDDYKNDIIDHETFVNVLKLIESYMFRRSVCDLNTNALNKVFMSLHKDIDLKNYYESLEYILATKTYTRRFPKNNEFKEFFLIKDMYSNKNIRNYILRKLENGNSKEEINISSYSVEHIMPQNNNLSDEWKYDLGENYVEIHEKYLHTIGNLTLTAYNSKLSDKSFHEKQTTENGFNDSPLRLNNYLKQVTTWNQDTIVKRAEILFEKALTIWTYPEVNTNRLEKWSSTKKYTLDDHEFLKENQPMSSIFKILDEKILELNENNKRLVRKKVIGYTNKKRFVDLIVKKKLITISLYIPISEINDSRGICRDMTNVGSWANGVTELKIDNIDDVDYAIDLIKESYNYVNK